MKATILDKAAKIVTERSNMPFEVKDCTLIARMAGIDTAQNLRELRDRLKVCPVECLFHHFCETAIRPSFDDPEFRNDFAFWAAHYLQDRVLAERLGIINPYLLNDFEELRQDLLDIVEERLNELPDVPWVRKGNEFRFMRAVTVIFDTGMVMEKPEDLVKAIPDMSLSAIYYHYVEARRRTEEKMDDFTVWLRGFGKGCDALINSLNNIDFYFMNLAELKEHLTKSVIATVNKNPTINHTICNNK